MGEIINDKIESLEKELAELKELLNAPKDNRVDFGYSITLTDNTFNVGALIATGLANPGDYQKVLIAAPGYEWRLHEDYRRNQNAVSLHKIK